MKKILLCLGRLGDVINILPIAFDYAQRGERLTICVAEQFQSILDGVSYADRIVWRGNYAEPDRAFNWLRQEHPTARVIFAQAYKHPTDKRRLTSSYQIEAWRLAGCLDQFGMWPTVFDQRSTDRERELLWRVISCDAKPMILVGLESVSSPLRSAPAIMERIRAEFGATHNVVDLSQIKAQRIYDTLGLFDKAECLVTADTVFLHLARASKVPVVALISEGNTGKIDNWFGSIPPPNAQVNIPYSVASPDFVVERIRNATVSPEEIGSCMVVHVCELHGQTERHLRAREHWTARREEAGALLLSAEGSVWSERNATAIGDTRRIPFLKDLFASALRACINGFDIIIWSNDDISFTEGAMAAIRDHANLWGATSIRRDDHGDGVHIGRELFAFRADWLRSHMDEIPDFLLGAPCFDLVIAAIIRKWRGVPSSTNNMHMDIFPCEMPMGLIKHEPHPSSWAGENEYTLAANNHNRALAKAWCRENCTTLHL